MGQTNFDVVKANAFIGSQFLTQGKTFFVKPRTGSDGASGLSPRTALKTLAEALAKCTANQNDVVYLMGESNTAGDTTDYQSATLDWNKDLVHLIGVNAGPAVGQRSRVAFTSAYATASNLFTVSANGCLISNIEFYAGVASASPKGCVKVTGARNVFQNCHLAGIGNDANDIADAYSLLIDGGAENVFRNCAIGLDTVARGTNTNYEIVVDSAATRNKFEDCLIYALIESATKHPLVHLVDATAIDRWLWFRNCLFLNQSVNYALAQAGVFKLTAALTQGYIVLENCTVNSSDAAGTAVKWDVDDRDQIAIMASPTPAADTAGVARLV